MKINMLLLMAIRAAVKAGIQILKVYESKQYNILYKEDESPLTAADIKSHETINHYLLSGEIPILSEEASKIPYSQRKSWEYFWLVDPLDGTREFLNRNDEFTVNIALIKRTSPLAGIIYSPVSQILYFSVPGRGVFKTKSASSYVFTIDSLQTLQERSDRLPYEITGDKITVITSRSFNSADTEKYILNLKNRYQNVELISAGSALKFGLIAEGKADIYPRFAPTMEWDVAAGHAILKESGFSVADAKTGDSLVYNKPDLENPWFIAKNSRI
jgi:3'(2'), 5'-bisphosphate nucleotidase